MKRKKLGEILQEAGLVSEDQIQKALKIAKQTGKRIGKILIEMEWVSEVDICQTLSKQLGIPMISLKNKKIDPKVLGLLPAKLCFKRRLVPLIVKDRSLVVAMNNPIDYEAMDEVSFASGHRVRTVVSLEQEILDILVRSYPPDEDYLDDNETGEYRVDLVNVIEEIGDPGDISPEKLEKAAKGGVIRQLTNGVILNAVRKRAILNLKKMMWPCGIVSTACCGTLWRSTRAPKLPLFPESRSWPTWTLPSVQNPRTVVHG